MAQATSLYNFSSGPAILDPSVLARASDAVRELRARGHAPDAPGIGLSILEISHRDAPYTEINEQAIALCHEVLGVPDTHEVIFLQGGATLQFGMVPLNFLSPDKTAYIVDTGVWSTKAYKDAGSVGKASILASSKSTNYDRIPDLSGVSVPADAAYVHTTSNNTIYGTEYSNFPSFPGAAHVVDCSSNIGSRPLDFSRVQMSYAGAQKNLGPSGITVLFVDKSWLPAQPNPKLPGYLDLANQAREPGLLNTPNTFGVLVLKLVLEWMKASGGVAHFDQVNQRKAAKLYACIDESSLYQGRAQAESRSRMNACWTLRAEDETQAERLTKMFLAEADKAGLVGLRGHRLAGGLRASIYNAFPEAGIDALIEFMREFERKH